jgi:hypothetical protein
MHVRSADHDAEQTVERRRISFDNTHTVSTWKAANLPTSSKASTGVLSPIMYTNAVSLRQSRCFDRPRNP